MGGTVHKVASSCQTWQKNQLVGNLPLVGNFCFFCIGGHGSINLYSSLTWFINHTSQCTDACTGATCGLCV